MRQMPRLGLDFDGVVFRPTCNVLACTQSCPCCLNTQAEGQGRSVHTCVVFRAHVHTCSVLKYMCIRCGGRDAEYCVLGVRRHYIHTRVRGLRCLYANFGGSGTLNAHTEGKGTNTGLRNDVHVRRDLRDAVHTHTGSSGTLPSGFLVFLADFKISGKK